MSDRNASLVSSSQTTTTTSSGREVRDTVIFASHDLLSDPPFSRNDLISCRNLLIYLKRKAQREAISVFDYALNPGGVLFLGTSESIERSEPFRAIDEQRGLFRRRDNGVRHPPPTFRTAVRRTIAQETPSASVDLTHQRLHQTLLDLHGPPSVLLDASDRVLRFSSRVGRYLIHPVGAPTNDVFQLVHEQLRPELRAAVHAARHDAVPTTRRSATMTVDGIDSDITVRAVPADIDDLVLVMFEEWPRDVSPPGAPPVSSGPNAGLAAELDEANRQLESVISQYSSTQDEMRISNEELQSTNEELRSTMEELETSKEELQSTNEELSALNQENRHKVEELAMLSSDLQNLLIATDIATLFLDRQLHIVRFTPAVSAIFNVVQDDRGRPLTDFTNRLLGHDLAAEAQQVLDTLAPIEHELRTDDGRWLLTRLTPYRTAEDRIDGVVATFVDITRRYAAEAALRTSEHGLRLALDAAATGTWWWDPSSGESVGDARANEIVGAAHDGNFVDTVADRLGQDDRQRWLDFVRAGEEDDVEFRLGESQIHIQVNVRSDDDPSTRARRRGTVRDVSAHAHAMHALAAHTDRMRLLADASAHLLRGTEPDAVLSHLFGDMSELLGLEIYEQFERIDGATVLTTGTGNWNAPTTDGLDGAHIGVVLCGQAVERARQVVFDDVEQFPGEVRSAAIREGLRAYGCFPMVAGGEVYGALCFGTRHAGRFDDANVELIQTIVDYMAVAEQRLRVQTELREMNVRLEAHVDDATRGLRQSEQQLRLLASDLVSAEQRERERIAQLLHDDLQQLLFGAQMRLELLRDDLDETTGPHVATHLDEAERYLRESITIARHLTAELAPPELEGDDLGEIVRSLAEQMREIHNLDVGVHIASELHITDRQARAVVHQTIRELLFNVVKHAGTDRAEVDLTMHDHELEIHVSDAGSGFDPEMIFSDRVPHGRGLATLRQRLSLVGGRLELESIPGDGTNVKVRLPSADQGDQ